MAHLSFCFLQLPPCALLLLNLLCASIAALAIPDIDGSYKLERGNKNIYLCGDKAEIGTTGKFLKAENFSFDGKPCSNGSFSLFPEYGNPEYSGTTNDKVGYRVLGHSYDLQCQAYRLFDVWISFSRPSEDVRAKMWGLKDTVHRTKGVKYFVVGSEVFGACLYREALKEVPTPGTSASDKSSDAPVGMENKRSIGLSIWVWLGPVIGAGATIVGAIITAVNWSRRKVEKKNQKLGIYDYEQDY